MSTLGPDDQSFELKADQELRFEVENAPIEVEVSQGLAEIFGVELVKNKKYLFPIGAKGALFTWHGCTINMKNAKKNMTYISKDTPMNYYMNVHIILEKQRSEAEKKSKRGPITMVVGPCDVGKSTLCHILLNYAVRMPGLNRKPIFVDLDVGQGRISVPGTIGAIVVERPATIEDGFSQLAPIVYNFGHVPPSANVELYCACVERMWKTVEERMSKDAKTNASGVIINTGGWVKGDEAFRCLMTCAKALHVDNILVLDQERLFYELKRELPNHYDVVLLPKSGGVVDKTRQHRDDFRDKRIKEYFYGSRLKPFNPHSFDIKFTEVQIFKIGAPVLPDSCMPLGVTATDFLTKVVLVTPGPSLLHHLLAMSFATSEAEILDQNVVGFVCVTAVDMARQCLSVLCLQARPLPVNKLVLMDVQYMDSN